MECRRAMGGLAQGCEALHEIGYRSGLVETFSPPPWLDLRMDARTVIFSVIIVLATTLLFGLAPSIQARNAGTAGALIGGTSRVAGSLPERRLLNGLVVAKITLATVLLASGGLLVRAYENLRNVDPGFRADGVATFRVSLPDAKYADGLSQRRFYETLVARIRQLPGVTSAGAVTCAPFTCH
jgi:putative ABC transport system permease protein